MPNILVNLPPGFFKTSQLESAWQRLRNLGDVRQTSHNAAGEIAADLAWAEVVLMWSWPALMPELLDQAKRLQFVAHLDVTQRGAKSLLDRKLPVSVARAAFSPAVAEMALTLILTTLRKTSDYHAAMRGGRETWVNAFPDDIDPLERELTGRSVGIIGFGRIGRRLNELLKPFRCTVRAYDPFIPPAAAQEAGVTKVELPELLASSDVVVLCAASNPGSAHLLGAKELDALRPHAVLVNVARAALVDTDALVARLERGDLYAAVDVFDKEPVLPDHPLRALPNAYLTPHRAGGLMASVERIINWLVDDIEAHLSGRPRQHALVEQMIPSLDA